MARSPIVDWLVQLDAKDQWDLDILTEHFNFADCTVIKDPDGKSYLKSERLQNVQNYEEVVKIAGLLVEQVNGIARAIAPGFEPVSADTLRSVHENGNRGVVIHVPPMTFRFPTKFQVDEIELANGKRMSLAEATILIANKDNEAANALRIYGGRPETWHNLYNVYELIREDVGDLDTLVRKGLAARSEIKRFTFTANNPEILGDEARHQAKAENAGGPKPMSHKEAKLLVRSLLKNWLIDKASKILMS